jgi:hypothetical protein
VVRTSTLSTKGLLVRSSFPSCGQETIKLNSSESPCGISEKAGPIIVSGPAYFDFIHYAVLSDCLLEYVHLDDSYGHDLEAAGSITGKGGLLLFLHDGPCPPGQKCHRDQNLQLTSDRGKIDLIKGGES